MKRTLLTLSITLSLFVANAQQDDQIYDGSSELPVLEGFSKEPTHIMGNTIEIVPATSVITSQPAFEGFVTEGTDLTSEPTINTIEAIDMVSSHSDPLTNVATALSSNGFAVENVSVLATDKLDKPSAVSYGGDIGNLLNQGRSIQWLGSNNRLRNLKAIRKLYEQLNYQNLWTQNGVVTELAEKMIKESQESWKHALQPEVYHTNLTSSLSAGQSISQPAKFDVLLTDAFITYKKHLANGVVNPKKQFRNWNQKPEYLNFAQLYQSAVNNNDLTHIFKVDNPDYKTLQEAYVKAIGVKNEAKKPTIKIRVKRLRFGDKGQSVTALRQRLGLPTNSDIYDKTVKAAVKKYQQKYGLGSDGLAGPRTLAHLNGKSLGGNKNKVNKLAINMERLRWQRSTPRGNYIWVNIPAFRMAVRNGKKHIFKSNVIVGRSARKTPIFSDVLEHVVLAPYWNVPSTIFKEDKLPRLKKNPNALGKGIQVVSRTTGKVVNPGSVNWSKGGSGYRLRQLPGARNSLGYMKFLFPNSHAIYLHDTPNRRLFKKQHRAFSSGCVRVERAEDLALFLLKDRGYNRKRVKKESRRKSEKWIKLGKSKRYPVFLDYYTAWVDDAGKLRYSNDVYRYDGKLSALYKKALKQL